MENYLFLSAVISIVALALLNYGEGSNNANYYLSSFAIVTWFIPYPILAELIPEKILMEPLILSFSELSLATNVSSEQSITLDVDLWLMRGLFGLMVIGVLLFLNRLLQSIKWGNQIMKDSSLVHLSGLKTTSQTPVYTVNQVSSGLLLGILKPVIIISNNIVNPKHINLILSHEQQHIKSFDNVRLLLLEITECLFWWNPLVRRLVKTNRFLIELRCDENASIEYGRSNYIEDLTSLILSNHHAMHNGEADNLVCSATSGFANNVTRIKLLKERRKMILRKKLCYALVIFTTIITMSWNTFATATDNAKNQQNELSKEQLGALVDFDINIIERIKADEENSSRSQMKIWVQFDEKASIKVGENFTFNFKAKDLGETVSLEYELIELIKTTVKTISKPRLTVEFGKEALIEIDNLHVSKNGYSIKATPVKAYKPS